MADYNALKTELAKPAYSGLSSQAAADLLNAPGASAPGPVQAGPLLIWAASTGVRAKVEIVIGAYNPATATAQQTAIYAACLAVRDMVGGGASQLSLDNPAISGAGGLLDGLTAAGVLPASGRGSKADLLALGSAPGPSVAQAVFGVPVSSNDVNHARSLS